MKITEEEARHIAHLSRLAITDGEAACFRAQLSAILSYMDKLNRLDTSEVAPMSHVLPLSNVFRRDIPEPSLTLQEAFLNAPDTHALCFRVPKILAL